MRSLPKWAIIWVCNKCCLPVFSYYNKKQTMIQMNIYVVKIRKGKQERGNFRIYKMIVLRNYHYYCPIDWSILVCWRNMHSDFNTYGQVRNKSSVWYMLMQFPFTLNILIVFTFAFCFFIFYFFGWQGAWQTLLSFQLGSVDFFRSITFLA